MTSLRLFALLGALAAVSLNGQTTIPVTGYTFSVNPGDPNHNDGRYADNSFTKLTDGIASASVWDGTSSPVDISPLVGWQSAVSIRFEFGAQVAVQTATFHFADSNGAAGVYYPGSLRLLDGSGEISFVTPDDPVGSGTTAPFTFNLNGRVTDYLVLEFAPVGHWNMMTEATFTGSAIPEPSTYAAIAGVAGLGMAVWRRKRRVRGKAGGAS